MKTHKLSLVAVITLGSLMAFGSMAKADDTDSKPAASAKAKGGARRDRANSVVDELNLTTDQKAKVKPIFQDEAQKLKALRQDTNLSKQDKMAKLKSIHEETDAKLKPILTPEQSEKLSKIRQEAHKKRPKQ